MKNIIVTFLTIFIFINPYISYGNISERKLFCKSKEVYDFDKYSFDAGKILDIYAYIFKQNKINSYYFFRDKDKILFKKHSSTKYRVNENFIQWNENWDDKIFYQKLNRRTLTLSSIGSFEHKYKCEILTTNKWNKKKNELLNYFQKEYDKRRIRNKI